MVSKIGNWEANKFFEKLFQLGTERISVEQYMNNIHPCNLFLLLGSLVVQLPELLRAAGGVRSRASLPHAQADTHTIYLYS